MSKIIMTEIDGFFEPDYGYNIEMNVNEKDVTILCTSVYNGWYFKTVKQFDVFENERIESLIFRALYEVMRETQRKIERLHEGC